MGFVDLYLEMKNLLRLKNQLRNLGVHCVINIFYFCHLSLGFLIIRSSITNLYGIQIFISRVKSYSKCVCKDSIKGKFVIECACYTF